MKFALLEPDLAELDRVLESCALSGHVCFGASNDEAFRSLLAEVSVDVCLIDWVDPDCCRYETLARLARSEPGMPVVLCVAPGTPYSVIDSGLKHGASSSIEKPFRAIDSLATLCSWETNSFIPSYVSSSRMM
ncbi:MULTISPECIES: response regulator [Paraburkholderia]|uniref:response regulator n=1 Tax=Paraburkholderia TaxID=1822464 RepID=UPI001CC3A975|nr:MULTISPECIES: response regulator [Paraburkholderia]